MFLNNLPRYTAVAEDLQEFLFGEREAKGSKGDSKFVEVEVTVAVEIKERELHHVSKNECVLLQGSIQPH